ncbi:hypothetical protein BDZ89DRAFT_1038199 [Hymenopellis radicata]|nr:hypothetical protein BDZ89DRAFT_1038199 [Hymenopellis radicata]
MSKLTDVNIKALSPEADVLSMLSSPEPQAPASAGEYSAGDQQVAMATVQNALVRSISQEEFEDPNQDAVNPFAHLTKETLLSIFRDQQNSLAEAKNQLREKDMLIAAKDREVVELKKQLTQTEKDLQSMVDQMHINGKRHSSRTEEDLYLCRIESPSHCQCFPQVGLLYRAQPKGGRARSRRTT